MILIHLVVVLGALAMMALLQGTELPPAVQVLLPLVTIVINFLVAKTSLGEKWGKRNVTAAASLPLALLAVYLMGSSLPQRPVWSGDLTAWLTDFQLWVAAVYGIWLSFWKAQQMLYDLLKGQVGLPDAIAARLK